MGESNTDFYFDFTPIDLAIKKPEQHRVWRENSLPVSLLRPKAFLAYHFTIGNDYELSAFIISIHAPRKGRD